MTYPLNIRIPVANFAMGRKAASPFPNAEWGEKDRGIFYYLAENKIFRVNSSGSTAGVPLTLLPGSYPNVIAIHFDGLDFWALESFGDPGRPLSPRGCRVRRFELQDPNVRLKETFNFTSDAYQEFYYTQAFALEHYVDHLESPATGGLELEISDIRLIRPGDYLDLGPSSHVSNPRLLKRNLRVLSVSSTPPAPPY